MSLQAAPPHVVFRVGADYERPEAESVVETDQKHAATIYINVLSIRLLTWWYGASCRVSLPSQMLSLS